MQATYSYDALGQRISKDVWSGGVATVTQMAYDDGRQIWVDMNGSSALQMQYLRTVSVLELPARVSSGGTAAWLLQDRLWSVRNVVDCDWRCDRDQHVQRLRRYRDSEQRDGWRLVFVGRVQVRSGDELVQARSDLVATLWRRDRTLVDDRSYSIRGWRRKPVALRWQCTGTLCRSKRFRILGLDRKDHWGR